MVSFRKSILLLALIAVFGIVAMAQLTQYPPYQCVANTANPPIARSEGFAEEVGQVQIVCNGGVPTAKGVRIPTVNVQVFLSTNITSRVLSDPWTEALLIMEEAGAARIAPETAYPQVLCGESTTGFDPLLGYCQVTAYNSIGTMDYTGIANPVAGTGLGEIPLAYEANRRPNIWQARCLTASCATSPQNQLLWPGVPLNPPGTGPARSMRLVNVRGNANALGVSSTFIPTQINMFISISGSGAPPLTNPNQTVAYVQQGLTFAVEAGRSGVTSPGPLFQCKEPPYSAPIFNSQTGIATGTVRGCVNLMPRFSENFPTAFRVQRFGNLSWDPTGGGSVVFFFNNQNIPGLPYNTESMFYNNAFPDLSSSDVAYSRGNLANAGVANNPTRLRIVFSNVPAGIVLYASRGEVASAIGGVPILTSMLGWYVNTGGRNLEGSKEIGTTLLDSSGNTVSGSSKVFDTRPDCFIWPVRETYAASSTAGSELQFGMNSVSLSLNSATGLYDGQAIYGVFSKCTNTQVANGTAANQCTGAAQLNNFWTGISVMYTGLPGLGTMNIAGSYAPTSTVDRWSASGGVGAGAPRFSPTTVGSTNIEIIACKTNLLFPFITNVGKYDTGIAISNTSRDPFGTRTQTGPCVLNFYGAWTSDPTRSTLELTTPTDVAAGTSYTFSLSGGVPNATNGDQTRTFQGYLIARCRFQYAHGYAFISDFGAAIFAQGYLALVMDDGIGSRTGSFSETLGN